MITSVGKLNPLSLPSETATPHPDTVSALIGQRYTSEVLPIIFQPLTYTHPPLTSTPVATTGPEPPRLILLHDERFPVLSTEQVASPLEELAT